MRIPITGNPDIDRVTVKTAVALMHAQAEASAKFAGLKRKVEAIRLAAWCQRQRALMTRRVKNAIKAVRHPPVRFWGPGGTWRGIQPRTYCRKP